MDVITYALAKKMGGGGESITYTLTADTENKTIVLTPSRGTAQVITVPYATDASTVNGHEVPELENGKIPANFLPSFVDNVDEYDNISLFPVIGESNRIYIDKSTNKTYRWSGTAYVEISESIALGETSSTAYRGDRGKIAYDHSQSAHAPSNAEANQNAFSNVKIDSDTINASTTTDTLEFIAGDNIILTPNVSNKKITVSQAPVRATASGDIASFSDGAGYPFLKVKANINPVQDLHGQDYPWVGGAGKNKVDMPDAHVTSQTTIGTKTLPSGTYVASATVKNNSNIGGQIGIKNTSTSTNIASATIPNTSSTTRVATNSFTLSEPTSISIIVSGAASGYDFDVSQIQVELGSTATTYAPYSNICPISGFTGVNVAVTGFNLFDKSTAVADSRWKSTGTDVATDTSRSQLINCCPNTSYYFMNVHGSFQMAAIYWFDAGGNYISSNTINGNSPQSGIIASPSNAYYVGINFPSTSLDSVCINISDASKNGTYEAYNSNSHVYPISWQDEAGIVYGGYIDLVSGVLTVTMASADLGALDYTVAQANIFFATVDGIKNPTSDLERVQGIISSAFKAAINVSISARMDDNSMVKYNGKIYIRCTDYSDTTAFKTAMRGQQLVYELATPQTYQLTPQQINTLIGQNNVWNNTNGQTEVEYKAPFYNDLTTKNEVQVLINESITSALNASY